MPKPNPCPWTPWFDRDDPSVTGDYEGLADLIKEGMIFVPNLWQFNA